LLRTADRKNISEQVIAMRSQNPSLSQAEIAWQLGVNKMRVSRILAREDLDENA
jgi:predicted XRE-type DNA-binding protein